jgi:hypothetical protein
LAAAMSNDGRLTIEKHEDDERTWYSLSFAPDDVVPLAHALAASAHLVNGTAIEAVMVRLSELGDPDWASELSFNSEADSFSVTCRRRVPLVNLLRRLEKRLHDRAALKRLVRAIPME